MKEERSKIDAGTASLDHYKQRLPRWRYYLRESLLPIVRAETPYVAFLQERMRSPALDTYFAMTANLGTHTFYMAFLPMLFWCGYSSLGRAMTIMLAAGVFSSGFIKDLLCLPRPLSPPLTRITMSGSAALEYGFPSSHSTNAVSVALYAILTLRDSTANISPATSKSLQALACFYACSIVLGRLYCGMHGFFDVIFGSLLGALLAMTQYYLSPLREDWLFSGSVQSIILGTLVILVLVRIHPEPADNCPCFDDSVAFAGVVLGLDLGCWHVATSTYADVNSVVPYAVPFDLQKLGWLKTVIRIVLGVVAVFLWRAIMKTTLLRILPPLFRTIENLGLDLPRRFFEPASQYKTVPRQTNDDDLIPSARAIPGMLSNLRRRRAISVGPQSEADAYEALAYRQKRRRDSLKATSPPPIVEGNGRSHDYFTNKLDANSSTRRRSLSLEEFRAQMGATSLLSPDAVATPLPTDHDKITRTESQENEHDKAELFATVQKPRVRYDVEVITKLVVYAGIAWLAAEGNPILFHSIGLT